MVYQMYSIYDKVAEQYGAPFCSLNDATATRSFNQQISANQLAEPTDFELYCVACFNTDTAQLTNCSVRFVCKGRLISNG